METTIGMMLDAGATIQDMMEFLGVDEDSEDPEKK